MTKPSPTPRVTRAATTQTSTAVSTANTTEHLRASSALVVEAVQGVTDLVEEMHRNISRLAPVVGTAPQGRTRGITGLVYRSVRGVTAVVGWSLDKALLPALAPAVQALVKPLAARLGSATLQAHRETMLAATNGVLGDTLAATGNSLAITMQCRQQGKALALDAASLSTQLHKPSGKLLILVHGLCMNDLQWLRSGHDHGAALALELGYTPVYLHYNTGRSVADNGADFAQLLGQVLAAWPVKVSELVVLGHSMGGLVTRSACLQAVDQKQPWTQQLSKLICLGTPHAGAPLERAGSWVDYLLGISPYTAPFAKLGLIRSQGIQDLRHGQVLPEALRSDPPAWPRHMKLYAVAATKQQTPAAGATSARQPRGDGLVPVKSALGQLPVPQAALPIPAGRQAVVYATDHFDLLSSPVVYQKLLDWLT